MQDNTTHFVLQVGHIRIRTNMRDGRCVCFAPTWLDWNARKREEARKRRETCEETRMERKEVDDTAKGKCLRCSRRQESERRVDQDGK